MVATFFLPNVASKCPAVEREARIVLRQ
jgi:hypothetical protein